jgi:tetratricopeptide (TPR) repeat protein/predicted Ser/Thr protein kinase
MGDPDQTVTPGGGPAGDEESPPFSHVGRFEVETEIGRGGSAVVYRAHDPTLERPVALKVLSSTDPTMVARFRREASAQARLIHDHICPVYDVGEDHGRCYIAMAFVDGRTLGQAAGDMSLESVVSVVADIADALHVAHREGLIHRDVKPSNILVGADDGGRHGWITDFGIVLEPAGEDLTADGATLGTPGFMAPEQVHADRRSFDRRTDVYGLGATLFSALCGRPPFEGVGFMTLVDIVNREAPRLRSLRPEIPPDVETIVAKCLEKDPSRRYESAAALADDLRAFLDGRAITARRADWRYRLRRAIARHRALSAVVAVAVLAVVTASGLASHGVWQARQAARWSEAFARDVREMEATVERAFMLPRHDIRPALSEVRGRMERIRTDMERGGAPARASGHHALGRGHLVLREYRQAREHLDRALDLGAQAPDLEYARGQVLGQLYQQAAERVLGGDREARESRLDAIRDEYRDPALASLGRCVGLDPARRTHVEGLIALYEGRTDAALGLAEQALGEDSSFYRAELLAAEALLDQGESQFSEGALEASVRSYAAAGEALHRALVIGRSDPAVFHLLCRWRTMELESGIRRGTATVTDFEEAAAQCRAAVSINPEDAPILASSAELHWRWGIHQIGVGEDPAPVLERSAALAERAVAIDPLNGTALNSLGVALSKLGVHELKSGRDPSAPLTRAIQAFDRAVAMEAYGHELLSNRGLAKWRMGQWALSRGDEPMRWLDDAAADFEAALAVADGVSSTWVNLGAVRLTEGMLQIDQGQDPGQSVEQAILAFERTLEISPRMAIAFNSLGAAHTIQAEWEVLHGRDPSVHLERGIRALRRGIEENPRYALAHNNLGSALATLAEYQLEVGVDPRPTVKQALAALDEALRINPRNTTALGNRGGARILEGEFRADRGEPIVDLLAAATDDLDAARRINPGAVEITILRARAAVLTARTQVHRGTFDSEKLVAIEAEVDEALTHHPDSVELLIEAGRLAAATAVLNETAATGRLDGAVVGVHRALDLAPDLARGRLVLGWLLLTRAEQAGDPDQRRRDACEATAAFDRVAVSSPAAVVRWASQRQRAESLCSGH